MRIHMSETAWAILAHDTLVSKKNSCTTTTVEPLCDRRFRSMFGMTAKLCSWYWRQLVIKGLLPDAFKPERFLWTLHFLRVYNTEEVNCTMFGCSEKTFRKWIWEGIDAIGSLQLVSDMRTLFLLTYVFLTNISYKIKWEYRNHNRNQSICRVTIDGSDFRICEPAPFDRRWYSHKFHGPGLRYEIGVCIRTGWIVWICGPFAPGDWPDLNIARHRLAHKLDRGEKYLADGGYRNSDGNAETPTGHKNRDQRMKATARARHETINGLMKKFAALRDTYRHNLNHHGRIFKAVANIVQAKIRHERATFQVDYNDRPTRP